MSMHVGRPIGWMVALFSVWSLGCAGGGGERAEPGGQAPPPAGTDTPPVADRDPAQTSDWTVGIVSRSRPGAYMTVLKEVRAAGHTGFDRVVFEFQGAELPGYHMEYVDRPVRQCGSGDAVEIEGDGWLQVRMEPSQAHDDEGHATVRDRERHPSLTVLREMESTCDFEGQVEWVLGVGSPNAYRILELQQPTRLVVDIRH